MQNKTNSKRTVVELYNRVAPFYSGIGPNFFKHCGERMVELGGIVPGARVLDVACGRGASLFPAAHTSGEGSLTYYYHKGQMVFINTVSNAGIMDLRRPRISC